MKTKFIGSVQKFSIILIAILIFGCNAKNSFAQESVSSLYIPLIGVTSVPDPLSLPVGGGNVKYNYAVKNFLQEVPLNNIQVKDDKCSPVKYKEGDDNKNSLLDYNETWRYTCTTKVLVTTENTATATGFANDMTAMHRAYSTIVVGSDTPAPLVSIVNITKVSYPYSLPAEGGRITFIYKVNNPGVAPLHDVMVTDNKCKNLSGKLGDTNGNNLLDINEVWIYTCSTTLTETTTNTVTVTAYANGLKAIGEATLTVKVAGSVPGMPAQAIPSLPETGTNESFKITSWAILFGILVVLIIVFILTQKNKPNKS